MFFAFFARTLRPWRRDLLTAKLARKSRKEQLFGFEPGAFTDARRRKEGLLERAHAGTLFLDEIGNMSPSVQAKLLRVLEEETFLRLGGTKPIKVDMRLVTATNTNLKEAVAQGQRISSIDSTSCRSLFRRCVRERKMSCLWPRHGAAI